MDVELNIRQAEFSRALETFAMLSGRSFEDELRNQGRLFVTDLYSVTPPFHRRGKNAAVTMGKKEGGLVGASEAKAAGEKNVKRNVDGLFIGRELVGARQVTHLFGRRDVPGLPFIVPTVEKYPDVLSIYQAEKRAARARAQNGLKMRKLRLPVSRVKAQSVLKTDRPKVGFLASGWNAAASRLGAKVPAFVKRHGTANGSIEEHFNDRHLRLVMVNQVRFGNRVSGQQRRVIFALKKRTDAMTKQIPRLLKEHAKVLA